MIFLTIGTLDPFDRLVQTVDELVAENQIDEEVIAQIGSGAYQPRHMKSFDVLEKSRYDAYMLQASFVISHAGMGSIITAVTSGKPMIVMPRLAKYREHVNDHQLDTARKFETEGVLLVANERSELLEKIDIVRTFKPTLRTDHSSALIRRVRSFLDEI